MSDDMGVLSLLTFGFGIAAWGFWPDIKSLFSPRLSGWEERDDRE